MQHRILSAIFHKFAVPCHAPVFKRITSGKIHDSFRVSDAGKAYVLQRLNTRVFGETASMMENALVITGHLRKKRCVTVRFHPARSGEYLLRSVEGDGVFRLMSAVSGGLIFSNSSGEALSRAAGALLGQFHRDTQDLPKRKLHGCFKDYHGIGSYFRKWTRHPGRTAMGSRPFKAREISRIKEAARRIQSHSALVRRWQSLGRGGLLPQGICHNDPKLANMVFDKRTRRGLCLIDLDTCNYGALHHDFGDAARSACRVVPRSGPVQFDPGRFQAFTQGYLPFMTRAFTADSRLHLFTACEVITLELAIRYGLDFLGGNTHFKIHESRSSLDQAMDCLDLLDSMGGARRDLSAWLESAAS